ncbi:MAG: lamin tail domain-containing protein [Planctomycetota bacterium]
MANGSGSSLSHRPAGVPLCETLEPRLMLSASVVINEFQAINDTTLADEDGDYADWIELHNPTTSAVNLDGWHLTDDVADPYRWTFPAISLPGGGYIMVYASDKDRTGDELHTNFKLTGDGEYLALTDADGAVVHAYDPQFPVQMADFSYGLHEGEEHYFHVPTPGAPNAEPYTLVVPVSFGVAHGIFADASEAFTLDLTTPTPGATIWYTVNGDDPTDPAGSRVAYAGPITIDRTRVIRATATRTGYDPAEITTQTYLFLDSVLNQGPDQSDRGMPDTWYNTNGGSSASNPEGFVRDADYEVDPDVPLTAADLLDVPAFALTVTNDDLFDPETGIYVNPIERVQTDVDPTWEKPASLELIDPTGAEDFTVGAGARIHGELARWVICNAKFNFRLTFESEYGPTKLETDFFPDSDVDRFDTIVLRGMWGESWLRDPTLKPPEYPDYPDFVSGSPVRTTYLRDMFAHDTFGATGNATVEGRFVHLYLNGLYWGLYQVIERPDHSFNAEHFGGEKEDWDIIKGAVWATDTNGTLKDGTREAWDTLFSFFDFDGSSNTTQVTPVSGADYEIIKQYLDVENLADYMITLCYIGRYDFPRKNWYAAGLPGASGEPMIEPFRFYTWDSEASLSSNGSNRTQLYNNSSYDTGPVRLYRRLRFNEEFQVMFADRLQKHFFNDGAMTPGRSAARLQRRADEMYTALMGESARWGDFSTPYNDAPLSRDVQWLDEYNWLMNDYFPVRTSTVLEQFRSIGLYPSFGAPQFSQHGGLIEAGEAISMTGPDGLTIYYTLDGSDPREPGSSGEPGIELALAGEEAAKRVLIPTVDNGGDQLGTSWLMPGFDDGDWIAGTGGVGYDRGGTNYDPYFDIDVESAMEGVNTSAFIRIPFTVDAADLAALDWMTLGVRCDDGFVAYLNGVKVAEDNNQPDATPGVPQWDNEAVTWSDESASVTLRTWNVNAFADALRAGENVLALHGLNAGIGSSDFLLSAELTAGGTASNGTPANVADTAVAYTGPFEVGGGSTPVKARAYDGATWSALTEAVFTVDLSDDLRITEINYHPHDPTADELAVDPELDDNDFEFIELANVSAAPLGLAGVRFTEGITFDFSTSPVTVLDPGEYAVVVADPAAFALRYGSTPRVAGTYSGLLSNGGERLTLIDGVGATIHDFTYDDEGLWPSLPDGYGSTLEIIDPAGDYSDPTAWRASRTTGGTPGAPSVPADFDFDGDVDLDDFMILKANFGLAGTATRAHGDATGDGNVDLDDFVVLKQSFGAAASAREVTGGGDALLMEGTGGSARRALRRDRRRRLPAAPTPRVDLLATARVRPLGRRR